MGERPASPLWRSSQIRCFLSQPVPVGSDQQNGGETQAAAVEDF